MNHCEMCHPDATNYGEIFPQHDLIWDGHYMIVSDHDEIYRFPRKPICDPFDGMTDEQIENAPKSYWMSDDIYAQYVSEMRRTFVFSPQQGHKILELCLRAGYKPVEGWLDYWICARAARMISAIEKTA